jgi:cell division GTPase FtsZ
MGMALMGTGLAAGESRAQEATTRAISSPLLEEASIEGAKGVLVNITGGRDLSLAEVDEAMQIIHSAADPEANIIFGTVTDDRMQNEMKITVIATGFDRVQAEVAPATQARPLSRDRMQAVTINLHAKTDFEKGDIGRISGHEVIRVDGSEKGQGLATALQDVRAGTNGWFEVSND